MCLQVFQSSFGVWALTVLGAATLGVPYFATEHTKKMACMDYFSRVYRLLPYGFSSFYPPFCTTGSVTAGDSVCLIPTWCCGVSSLHFCSLPVWDLLPAVPKYFSAAAYEVHRLFSVQISLALLYSLVSWPLQGFPKIIVLSLNSWWVGSLQSLPIPWQWQRLEAVQCN